MNQDKNSDLYNIYERFALFGSSVNLQDNSTAPLIDGAKFAKFTRDCKIISATDNIKDGSHKVTQTDVDIIFNRVKGKQERRIDFAAFQRALHLLAEIKYPSLKGRDSAYNKLVHTIVSVGSPNLRETTEPERSNIVERLTDTSKYTGTHKQRFDSEGRGRGKEGRVDQKELKATTDMSELLRPQLNTNSTLLAGGKRTTAMGSQSFGSREELGHSGAKKASTKSSSDQLASSGRTKSYSQVNSSSGGVGSKSDVFNRLTNVNQYTGTHKLRFDQVTGQGRGIEGRDAPAKGGAPGPYRGGDVKDLSQILRS